MGLVLSLIIPLANISSNCFSTSAFRHSGTLYSRIRFGLKAAVSSTVCSTHVILPGKSKKNNQHGDQATVTVHVVVAQTNETMYWYLSSDSETVWSFQTHSQSLKQLVPQNLRLCDLISKCKNHYQIHQHSTSKLESYVTHCVLI